MIYVHLVSAAPLVACCALFWMQTVVLQSSRASLKGMGEMSSQELRAEFKRLYREDLPYADYMRAMALKADTAWMDGDHLQRIANERRVYGSLMEAVRYLTGAIQMPADAGHRRYIAATRISIAFTYGNLDMEHESVRFHREVFQSPEFQKSDSVYHDAIIDLWQRFEKAGRSVPYYNLLGLNQPTTGRPGGQSHFVMDLSVADMYTELAEHETAARWYEKVPPEGLGALKAADAYFLAKKYTEAERLYGSVFDNLDDWVTRQPELRKRALAMPLQTMDPEATKRHVAQRLVEIDRILRSK